MKKLLYTIIFSFFFLMGSELSAQSQNLLEQGMRFVEQNAEKWELIESDYETTLVSDMYTHRKTGITHIYLIQSHNGIPIHNAITPLSIDTKGKVRTVRHGFVSHAAERINSTAPVLEPVAAIKSAVSHLGLTTSKMPTLLRSNQEENSYEFGKADFSDNELTVKLMYVKDGEDLKLAWNMAIDEKEDEDYYNTFVDAISGEVITKYNYTVKCNHHFGHASHKGCNKAHNSSEKLIKMDDASTALSTMNATNGTYNVFPFPTESPIHGDRQLLTNPYFEDVSPFGWHDTNQMEGPEWTITRGNNVHAFLDKENTDTSSGDEPDGGEELIFDLPYDINDQAAANEDAAVVNLFYTVNMIHDITSRLGFDEQSGNFQANNYGNGGNGNDFVLAQASDGRDAASPTFDNANFSTPPDGGNGRMQMFLWNNPSGVVSIDEPEEISGFVSDVVLATDFGGTIPDETGSPISGRVVVARDVSPGNPTTCCNPIENVDEIAGNIALIDRGLCDFSLKTYNAQQAGAISVIICNIEGGSALGGMSGGEQAENVTIVPVLLAKEDCDRIRASILSDIDVTITIQNRGPVGPTYLDGSFDNGIIAHEFGHGVSNRLIGGPGQTSCVGNAEQSGEGISDFFTIATTVEEGDTGADPRGIGNYATAENVLGGGIRTFPYSTDMSVNPLVYDDIKTRGGSVHAFGEIWCTALWEVYWALVDQDGLDTSWEDENSGNYKAVRLAIEGMKLSPCESSVVDLRDGVLLADSLLYDAAHTKLLWIAFAKRGLGYLADDGGNSNDVTDGTQSFEPFPLVIEELKISARTQDEVDPGEEVTVDLTAINHIPETQTNVRVTVTIPEGLTYVDGSATVPATLVDGELILDLGDMAYLDEMTMSYRAIASGSIESKTFFYDDVDNADQNLYDFGATEGFNLWFQSFETANSGFASWWASAPNPDEELDFFMNIPTLDVVGERPALKFTHRFDTETGADGGFILVSNDGGILYDDVKEKWLRNGYNSDIQYGTFAIPLLEAYSGSTNEEWITSYLDLSDYEGQEIHVRFRFGTDDNTGVEAPFPGWYVDDLELIDLASYQTLACITSDNAGGDQCTEPINIIVSSDQELDTSVEELDGFDISLSPNPASDYLSIGLSAEQNTPVQLLLTSIDGTIVKSMNLIVGTNQSVRTINTSNLQKGMYLVQVKTETGLTTKKVVIQ